MLKFFVWSVALCGAETWTLRRSEQKRLEAFQKDGACKMDRQNKICSCARKSGRMKNNAGTDKEEEKKLAEPLAKKELPAEGCSGRNGKREESSRQKRYKMIDNIMENGLNEDTKRKAEKRVDWRKLSLQ